jgi:uncharacterized protein DUF3108
MTRRHVAIAAVATAGALAFGLASRAEVHSTPRLKPAPWVDGEALWFVTRRPAPTPTPTPRPGGTSLPFFFTASTWQGSAMIVTRGERGTWRLAVEQVRGGPELRLGLPPYTQSRVVEAAADTLAPIEFLQRESGGNESRARYGSGRVEVVSSRTGTRTYELQDAAFDEMELEFVLRRLPLEEGYLASFSVFAGGVGVFPVKVAVLSRETLAVPAGRFECFKVRVDGGRSPRTFWITADDHRYLVQYEERDTAAELVRIGTWNTPTPLEYKSGGWNLSLTAPGGWLFQPPTADQGWMVGGGLVSADGAAQCTLRAEDFLLLLKERPAEAPPGWRPEKARKFAEREIKPRERSIGTYDVRADSWREVEAAGVARAHYVADVTARNNTQMVEYAAYWTQPLRGVLICMANKDAFEARRAELDAIIDSVRLR